MGGLIVNNHTAQHPTTNGIGFTAAKRFATAKSTILPPPNNSESVVANYDFTLNYTLLYTRRHLERDAYNSVAAC